MPESDHSPASPAPPGGSSSTAVQAAVLGIGGAWCGVLVQLLFGLWVGRHQLASLWEIQTGAAGLAPIWLLLALAPGALGALGARLVAEPSSGLILYRRRLFLSLAGAFFGGFVGWGVGGGRHLASWGARGGFALAVACCAAAALFMLSRPIHRTLRTSHGMVLVTLAALIFAALLEVANFSLLVRLYPVFHGALSFLTLLLAGASAYLFWSSRKANPSGAHHRQRGLVFLAVALTCAVLVLPGARAVRGFDNFRWVIQERSPSLAWGLEIASLVAPPPALDESLQLTPLGARRKTASVDFRGRDILLISVDALRADHLGAYGYRRKLTPAMDKLAREGVLFEAAYAPTPHTSYSITSLMTGKYMKPLLLQGAGADSQLWASLMQGYDYRTAAFYPPAVFFIDTPRFAGFQAQKLGFEYAKIEFAEGDARVAQVAGYLKDLPQERHAFIWVHLFGPHEPYEPQAEFQFGDREIDLYDGEVAAADQTVGRIVDLVRARNPDALVLLTADHGEEFGDHGGRYHGTSVFDEQVRVPLIVSAKGLATGARIRNPVQTIDLLPTVLAGLKIPIPPRVRGASLLHYLERPKAGERRGQNEDTWAIAETDDYTLLAEQNFRLICQRRSGACQLFDTIEDPGQLNDVSRLHRKRVERMRQRARKLAQSHGKYESQGLRAEGKGWPPEILLGMSGNAQVAPQLALFLDDADVAIRRKSAEILFKIASTGQAPALRLAMSREEDQRARAWIALSLTKLGQGAPLVFELLQDHDLAIRRLAALALAYQGDSSGERELISWWLERDKMEFETAQSVLHCLGAIRSKKAAPFLMVSLKDGRLRPYIARALAEIGDKDALAHLAIQLRKERFHSHRAPLAEAIIQLGGDDELILPLRRFLGVPDPLTNGIGIGLAAGILEEIGGPQPRQLQRLRQLSDSGVQLSLVVPPAPEKASPVRIIVRVRSRSGKGGTVFLEPGRARAPLKKGKIRSLNQPSISSSKALRLHVAPRSASEKSQFQEIFVQLPKKFGAKPGHTLTLEVFSPRDMEIDALVAVPMRDDLPPPAPKDWKPEEKTGD